VGVHTSLAQAGSRDFGALHTAMFVQVVGGVLDPDPVEVQAGRPSWRSQVPVVPRRRRRSGNVVRAEPEHRRVVEHPAGLVADRGVDDLGRWRACECCGLTAACSSASASGAHHLELAQTGTGPSPPAPLAARPVLVDRTVGRRSWSAASRPRYSVSCLVSLDQRGWKAVWWVSFGAPLSGGDRDARDRHREPPLGPGTRGLPMSVGFQALAGSMVIGAGRRGRRPGSVMARSRT